MGVAEVMGERPHLGADLGVRVRLVLEHDVRLGGVELGQFPDRAHRRRCRVEHPHRRTADFDLGHREARSLGCQFAPRIVEVSDHPPIMPCAQPAGRTRGGDLPTLAGCQTRSGS